MGFSSVWLQFFGPIKFKNWTVSDLHCIIIDGILSFPIDIGHELGIPIINSLTTSACPFWPFFSIQDTIEAGELPMRGNFHTLASMSKFVSGVFLFRCMVMCFVGSTMVL